MYTRSLIVVFGAFAILTLAESISQAQAPVDLATYVTPALTDEILLPTTQPEKKYLSKEISIFASPGEYEPASFSIFAVHDLEQVVVQVTDLKSGADTIPALAVDIRVVKCWYQGGHSNRKDDKKYLTPELLLKDDDFVSVDPETQVNILRSPDAPRDAETLQPVNVAANTQKQLWVTLHVPDEAAAGVYSGLITISASDGKLADMTLKVEVLPIKLASSVLDYMIYYGAGRLDPAGQGESSTSRASEYVLTKSEEQFRAELRNLKAHGITWPMIAQDPVRNDDASYNFTSLNPLLEWAMTLVQEEGFSGVPLLYLPYGGGSVGPQRSPEEIEVMKQWVRQIVELGKTHGFTDVYFYGIDEAQGEVLKAQRPAWQAVHEAGGKVFASAYSSYTNWHELVGDLLDMGIEGTVPIAKNMDQIHGLGHTLVCMRNSPVQKPIAGLTTRCNYGLGMWLAGFDGGMDFSYQFAHGNIYDDTDNTNWDYVYAYPTVNGVVDTVQWEAWREAVDDVRYLSTLLNAIEKAKAKGGTSKDTAVKAQRWVNDLRSTDIDLEKYYAGNWYTLDGQINFAGRDIQTIRRQMAQLIIKLQE